MAFHLSVEVEQAGMQLDEFLASAFPGVRKSLVRQAVRDGRVSIDGEPVRSSKRLHANAVVSVDLDEDALEATEPEVAVEPATVLYEDEHVLAIDKPSGVAVEPERWDDQRPSVAAMLLELARRRGDGAAGAGAFRPRIVHRLDKDTSGVMLAAKSLEGERVLREAFDGGTIGKRYLALVEGEHPLADGETLTIDLAIGPDARRTGRMQVARDGKAATTRVAVVERFRGYTLLACEPLTGRTHQIRVHLAAEGFPLAVDPLYGRRKALLLSELKSDYRKKIGEAERPLIERSTLHSQRVEFPTPARADRVAVEAPLPKDFARALKQLAKVRPPRSRPRR